MRFLLLTLTVLASACSSSLPARYVLEHDVDGLSYRRYQRVLDLELVVAGNPGEGHTAAYVTRDGDSVRVATAFVSVYDHPGSLTAEVRARLETLGSYSLEVVRREGENLYRLHDDAGDEWLVWVSGRHVVKLGGPPNAPVPEALVSAYLDVYPSDLDRHGHARQGAASAGPAAAMTEEAEDAMPAHLREGAPR